MSSMFPICDVCGTNSQFFCTKNDYDVYACKKCGFTFVYPLPSTADLEALYSADYFSNKGDGFGYTEYDKDKEPMRSVFALYLTKLRKLTKGNRLFDVGAATGYFLDMAKEAGWVTLGSEISEFGRLEAARRGHEMVGTITSADVSLPRVHVVTLWDVLEHVDNPRLYIQRVRSLLEDGGVVAINTVDIGSVWARIFGKYWHLIVPPEHLHYFSNKSLTMLLEQEGFEVLEVQKIGKSFSLPYIFKTLAAWQHLKVWEWGAKFCDKTFLRKVSIPINLRDNIFVIARKKYE